MIKVDGLYLNKDEVFVLQSVLAKLLKTEDANEAAKKVSELKENGEYIFYDRIGTGMVVLELMSKR